MWDHPRLRGEKAFFNAFIQASLGSPPPARGEVRNAVEQYGGCGITPACAGRSAFCNCQKALAWDHPRLRGEKAIGIIKLLFSQGSPPPVRGEALGTDCNRHHTGITPACAGRRALGYATSSASRDHPRLRGEKEGIIAPDYYIPGSPPPARGEADVVFRLRLVDRITPACAGRSRRSTSTF